MSQVYKSIRRFKELVLECQSRGWTQQSILDASGVNFRLFKEIMEFDPVAVRIRSDSVEKIDKFITEFDGKPKKESAIPDKPATPKPPEPSPVGTRSIGDSLDKLTELMKEFSKKGYTLKVEIQKTAVP